MRDRLGTAPDATIAELEPVAAASLTDGFELVQQLHGRGVRFELLGVPLGGDRPKLDAELAALDEAVDALGDALTAEGVFQLVRGNPARAAASVDAIAHGEIQPPELHFAETPRPGTALTHRLVALFSGPAPAPRGRRARGAARGGAEARRVARADGRRAEERPPPRRVRRRRRRGRSRGDGRAPRRARRARASTRSTSPPRPRRSCPPTSSGCSSTCSCEVRPRAVPPTARVRLDARARRRLRGRRPEPRRVPAS